MPEDLVLAELNKVYHRRDKQEVHAVRDIDLEVRQGKLLALLGPSGCGKSSTLRMIAGLEEVTSGDILIGGSSVVSLPPHRRNIALAFENYALYPPLTVQENITFGLRARSARDPEKRARDRGAAGYHRHPGAEARCSFDRTEAAGESRPRPRTRSFRVAARRAALPPGPRPAGPDSPRDQAPAGGDGVHDRPGDARPARGPLDGGPHCVDERRRTPAGRHPEEVYDDPDNLFVAGFVGDPPMNLLRGRARKTERGMSMWLSDETDLPVANSSLSPDQQVVVGIRPQDVHVVESDGPDVIHATVFAFEPLQETGLLTATLPGVETRIEAETDPHARYKREEAVKLRFDPDRIRLFDAESGDRFR